MTKEPDMAPQPSPAASLGLVDGQFLVKRTGGIIETGWSVKEVGEGTFAGTPGILATITRPDEASGQNMKKTIPVDQLHSWQPTEEDLDTDTVPREQLLQLGITPVRQTVEPIRSVEAKSIEETPTIVGAEEVPAPPALQPATPADTTVDGSSTEAATADPQASAKTEISVEPSLVEEEQEAFVPKATAVADIAERVGLTAEATAEEVELCIRSQMEAIQPLIESLQQFNPVAQVAAGEIRMTLSQGRNALTGSSRQQLNEYLQGGFALLTGLAADDRQRAMLPATLRRSIESMSGEIRRFRDMAEIMMGREAPSGMIGAFDTDAADPVLRTLTGFEGLERAALLAHQEAEHDLAEVIGFRRVDEEYATRMEAQKKAPTVEEVLRKGERTKEVVRLNVDLGHELAEALHEITAEKPTKDEITDGIRRAQQLVANGKSKDELASISFTSDQIFREQGMERVEEAIWLEEPIYVRPEKIIGAGGFNGWTGRGVEGNASVGQREGIPGAKPRPSIEQIEDYATRETMLPVLNADGGLLVIQARNGTFVFSANAHRAAAAKLRGEPLGTTALELYKFDGEL